MIYQDENCSTVTYRNSELHVCPHLSLSSVIRHLWSLQFNAAMVQILFWNRSHHTFVEPHLESLKVLIYLKQKLNEALRSPKFTLKCMWVKPCYCMRSLFLISVKTFFFPKKKSKIYSSSYFFFSQRTKYLKITWIVYSSVVNFHSALC